MPLVPLCKVLLKPDLQSTFATVTDRFGEQIAFLLERHVDDASLCGIEYAKGKRPAVLADLIGGKAGHRVKLGLARLPKALGVDYEPVLAIDLAAKRLKKNYFKGIEHLAVLGKGKMGILAGEIQQAALIGPFGSNGQIESQVLDQAVEKILCLFTSFVHLRLFQTLASLS